MNSTEINKVILNSLYKKANPIIKNKMNSEFFNKQNSFGKYNYEENNTIMHWFNAFDGIEIHGSKDSAFENAIGKLLDFGFNKNNELFDNTFKHLLSVDYWQKDSTFYSHIYKHIISAYMIRSGYYDNVYIKDYFHKRLTTIENTISKYGYDFWTNKKPKKHENDSVFSIDINEEALPTIYDLYALAFYPKKDKELNKRITNIVTYLLDKRFQKIPKKSICL
ncbi:MAG: hypothetical protein KAQ68_06630 [Clostridiales bacterium]|nr:hypothetical protein [Clostridiales bacterium]